MKAFTFFVAVAMLLASCGSGGPRHEVQHDTLQTGNVLGKKTVKKVIDNGEYIKHYKSGAVEMQGMMKDGKRDGLWKSFYENGKQWSETEFFAGKKNGHTITWYENGNKRYEGTYTNDTETGAWTFYDESGKVIQKEVYDAKK